LSPNGLFFPTIRQRFVSSFLVQGQNHTILEMLDSASLFSIFFRVPQSFLFFMSRDVAIPDCPGARRLFSVSPPSRESDAVFIVCGGRRNRSISFFFGSSSSSDLLRRRLSAIPRMGAEGSRLRWELHPKKAHLPGYLYILKETCSFLFF